ncbi:hypothetical protein PTKIN_Ptkin09bG0267800 [Pterospermum kingtungense]
MVIIFASSSLSWPYKSLSFPDAGISIGVTFCHVAADGRTFGYFTKSWASICRSLGDLTFVKNSPPDYSRDLIQDPRGIWSIFLQETADRDTATRINPPTDNFRISPVISQSHVKMLKTWIARKYTEVNEKDHPRLSTFVVSIALMWVCLIKLYQCNKTPDPLLRYDDDAICAFVFLADCRDRIRLPTNYFGNCLKPCLATAKRSELIRENGVFVAAKAIRREIEEFEKEPLKGVENWISSGKEVVKECEHYVTLAGSPKLRLYETDFGFGRPKKSEVVHIGSHKLISIAESRDEEGGVEFGLAFASSELDKFNAVFEQGLLNL